MMNMCLSNFFYIKKEQIWRSILIVGRNGILCNPLKIGAEFDEVLSNNNKKIITIYILCKREMM